jgi:hypothetical protein
MKQGEVGVGLRVRQRVRWGVAAKASNSVRAALVAKHAKRASEVVADVGVLGVGDQSAPHPSFRNVPVAKGGKCGGEK